MLNLDEMCVTLRYWFPNHELRIRWQREGDVIRIYASDVEYDVLAGMVLQEARGAMPPLVLRTWGKDGDESYVGWEVRG